MGMRQNIIGNIDGQRINFPRFLHNDISLSFETGNNFIRKEIIISSNENLPRAPERLLGFNCSQWCGDCPARFFIDYKLYIHDDLTMYVDGRAWGENIRVDTTDGINLKDSRGVTQFSISPSYMIGNYTGASSYYPMRYELKKVDDYIMLRASVHYYDFMANASYPLLIDPEIIIQGDGSEINWDGSSLHFNIVCQVSGSCCTPFPGGVCNQFVEIIPTCAQAFISDIFLPLTRYAQFCGACAPFDLNCCRVLGTRRLMMLLEYNWSSQVDIDYNQVNVNWANLSLAIPTPAGNVSAIHHDTEEGLANVPYCDQLGSNNPVHDEDNFEQPPEQVSANFMQFNFTDHVQDEFYDNFSEFYIFLSDNVNNNSALNRINDTNLTINFSFDPCRPPFDGQWIAPCGCDIVDEFNASTDLIINETGDGFGIDGHITFIEDNLKVRIDEPCEFVINPGGGIN